MIKKAVRVFSVLRRLIYQARKNPRHQPGSYNSYLQQIFECRLMSYHFYQIKYKILSALSVEKQNCKAIFVKERVHRYVLQAGFAGFPLRYQSQHTIQYNFQHLFFGMDVHVFLQTARLQRIQDHLQDAA